LPSNFALKLDTGIKIPEVMQFQPALGKPCIGQGFRISSPVLERVAMNPRTTALNPLLAGLIVTVAQLFFSIVIAPPYPLSLRYDTLIQHDSYWFANIVDRGYGTTVPPPDHKVMEVSNVAFFPAYPALSALIHLCLPFTSTYQAMLVAAQISAWGFWSYFFLLCQRWKISALSRFFGALTIAAHPTAFFLVAGYSESLFMMALLGFIYWSSAEGRLPMLLAALHGFVMSATRIVGIPCAMFPIVRAFFTNGWRGLREVRFWRARYGSAIVVTLGALLGAATFFFYCLARWGRWDMYMLTQQAGWAIEPDYLAVFRGESYQWLIPALDDPTEASQMATTLGAVFLVGMVVGEFLPIARRTATWPVRIGFYFCGAIIFYISVSGVACVNMESMLRYEFCLHALIVLAFVHFLHQLRTPPRPVRLFGMATIGLLSVAGVALQSWYVWNFTRGNWVA
jgi:hypothetical protein